MNVNRNLLNTTKNDRVKKRSITSSDPNVLNELKIISPIITNHLENSRIEKTSNWMLYMDYWLQNEDNVLQTTRYRNYSRGDIISTLDWGTTNIGTEVRYPHPGVVLFDDGEDWIIAAPLTGASKDSTGNLIKHKFEVLVNKQNSNPNNGEYWFRKDTVIQVDQIKRVSKYRILNVNSYKLRTDLLNEIDNIVLENLLPKKYELIDRLKDVIKEKDNKIQVLIDKLKELEQ